MVTGEMVEELILSGADIIKVGVGPGKICWEHSRDCGQGAGAARIGIWGLEGPEMPRRYPMNDPSTSLKHISFGSYH